VTETAADRSYRALLGVPALGRIILSMQIARTAQSMLGVAIVLFTLAVYDSPGLAGIVTFASIFPGLLLSPIAGALLDRHGRVRLIVVDYAVAVASLVLIGGLALAGLLPAWLLVVIALVSSVTGIFSHTGLRSLFPILVPRHLWERVNAVDSNGYVIATILGPPLAAGLVAAVDGPVTILGIAAAFGVAGLVMIRVPEPHVETALTGRLLADAWQGLAYWWRNPTLRGLGL
jgi:MFS family permease